MSNWCYCRRTKGDDVLVDADLVLGLWSHGYDTRLWSLACGYLDVKGSPRDVAEQNIEAIANVDGVDGVFIGPGDLSAALGHLGNPKHPEVLKVIDESIARIRACGKAAGILTGDEALAKHYVEQGCLFVAVGADQNVLRDSATALAGRFKS